MKQHALRTALTLYGDGTYDVETAAASAGISVEALRRALARTGRDTPVAGAVAERERVSLGAD